MAQRVLKSGAPLFGTAIAGGAAYATYSYLYRRNFEGSNENPALLKPLSSSLNNAPKTFGSTPWFKTLTLKSTEDVNHDTKRLRFSLPEEDALSGLQPISALLTRAFPNDSWIPTFRPYTPISDPVSERGYIDLLVKKYPAGKMSPHLHSLKPGDTHAFFGIPLPGGYSWPQKPGKSEKHVALIAGGAGITPIYQFTKAVFRDASGKNPSVDSESKIDVPKITLIFGVNTPSDLLFHDEFRALERQFPDKFNCIYTVSHPPKESLLPRDYDDGYINRALLDKHLPEPHAEGGVKVVLCGPPGMEEAIAGKRGAGGILGEMGFRKEQIQRL